RGNHDGEWEKFPRGRKNEAGYEIEYREGPYSVDIEGILMSLYHGDKREVTEDLVKSGVYDIVLSAHTHKPYIRQVGKTTNINPGHFKVPIRGTGD
ncbi:MAG: metallophosphoesterase family protein, partial [Candidatus Aenigmatarchaeota archaeon]